MNLDEIRQEKIERLKRQAEEQNQEQETAQQLEQLVKARLTKKALSRFGNIKTAHPDLAVQAMMLIAQLLEQQPQKIIEDHELKKLLELIHAQKKDKQPNFRFR